MKEELGLDVTVGKLIGFHESVFPEVNYHLIIFFYSVKASGEPRIGEKRILDVQYFDREELEQINLVSSARWVLKKLH